MTACSTSSFWHHAYLELYIPIYSIIIGNFNHANYHFIPPVWLYLPPIPLGIFWLEKDFSRWQRIMEVVHIPLAFNVRQKQFKFILEFFRRWSRLCRGNLLKQLFHFNLIYYETPDKFRFECFKEWLNKFYCYTKWIERTCGIILGHRYYTYTTNLIQTLIMDPIMSAKRTHERKSVLSWNNK